MADGQIVQWGNSLAVRIPKPLAQEAGLRKGDRIHLRASEEGLAIRRAGRVPTLEELLSRITQANRYGEEDTGRPRGRENIEW